MPVKKLNKKLNKLKSLISKNKDLIKQIIVSEDFMLKLAESTIDIGLTMEIEEDTEAELWFMYDVPILLSNFIKKGAVLEMDNDEVIVLKNF